MEDVRAHVTAATLLAMIAMWLVQHPAYASTSAPAGTPPLPVARSAATSDAVASIADTATQDATATPALAIDDLPEDRGAPKLYLRETLPIPVYVPTDADVVSVVVAGDTGFARDMEQVHPHGFMRFGRRMTWDDATQSIRAMVDGDINFANLETIVTDRNDMRGEPKSFRFRTHPEGVRHLVDIGFNVLSLANNHSMDFGRDSATETLKHLKPMLGNGLHAHAGVGYDRDDATAARSFEVRGNNIAFSAIGIITRGFGYHRAGPDSPGQAAVQSEEDWQATTTRLAETPAAYRMLSIHYGANLAVEPDSTQLRRWREDAVVNKGIDLVIGHHPHVPQGVERVGNRVIFYGLGNFLHPGMSNMAGKGVCRDFGLVGRVHLLRRKSGKLEMRAIEAIPVTEMHHKAQGFSSTQQSHQRIEALNFLADRLDGQSSYGGEHSQGVRFSPRPDGSGLFCMPGAENDPGRIGDLCRDYEPVDSVSSAAQRRVSYACRGVAPRNYQAESRSTSRRKKRSRNWRYSSSGSR